MKYFIYSVIGVVTTLVLAGFFIVGSPKAERMRQFDERRINDLNQIQYNIVNFWQNKGSLPPALADLRDDIGGVYIPVDPETNAAYEYAIKGVLQFELCATFSTDSNAEATLPQPMKTYPTQYNEQWTHGVGRTCFTRTIDTDRYPLFKK